jgi:hypothetical protein
MYAYLDIPTKLFSIIIFTAISFLIILTYVFNQDISVNLRINAPSPRLLLLLVYVFCLLIILLLPGVNESVFVSLSSLRVVNWLRALAGLLLGVFLPGYAIISLFKHQLNPISLSISSILLTIFIDATITFIAITFAQSALTWMLIINTLIVSLSLIDTLRDKTNRYSLKHTHSVNTTLDNVNILMLLLCLFQLSILISIFLLSGLTVPNGDMWDHAAMATRVEKGEFLRFGLLIYPPFFSVHLFSVSQLTGLPAISISNLLGLTNIFVVLAFYALVLTLTRKRSVAFLSTFALTMFGSFTFLVQAILGKMVADPQGLAGSFLQVSGKTMQTNSIYPLANIHVYAPVTLHLISILVLTALFLQKDKGRILYAVEAFLIANLFLLHVAETIYVLIFLLAALILNLSKIKDLASLTLGVWLGTAALSILPFTKSSVSLYVTVVYTVVLVFTLLCTRLKLLSKLHGLYGKTRGFTSKGYVRVFLAFAMLSMYGFLMLVWKVLYLDVDGYMPGVLSYLGAAPTYFMPVAFGTPLVISLLYFAKCLVSKDPLAQNEEKVVIFLVAAFIIAYLFGKAITLANISGYMIYRELRVLQTFGGILFSIVSGYALYKTFQHFKGSKINQRVILAVGLGLLILLGSGSPFLSAVFWTNRGMGAYSLHSNEIEALDFLKRTVNASDVVLTYNSESKTKVGLTGATIINRFAVPFSSVSPSIPRMWLQLQPVDYIYLTKQDYDAIQKSDTYMKSLIPLLPVIFNNSEVMIFSVPQIKSYMGDLSIPVVISRDLKEALPKLAILDSLGVNYRIYDKWDPGILADSSTVILTDDVENASDAQKYVDWVHDGGHLIILGENEGYYSNLMNIQTRTKIVFQEAWLSEASFRGWDFDLRGGLNMSDVSISTSYQHQGCNSLFVNATTSGTLGLAHPREWPKDFPFAIGTWFMLIENRSTIKDSLILRNALNVGVGLWDENYSLDYYYDGGKITYDIAEISPGSWQKIELYFPDPTTCHVYINDTLIFVGPRSTRYDPPEVTYAGEYEYTLSAWFTGRYSALWNGLYYAAPDVTTANGILCEDCHVPLDFKFNVKSPKESRDKDVQVVSWYTLDDEKVVPLTFTKEVGSGKLIYVDSKFPAKVIPELSNFSKCFLKSIDPYLLNYIQENTEIKPFPPIEIYGDQSLNGNISIDSDTMYFWEPENVTYSLELGNGTQLSLSADRLALYSPFKFTLSLNGSVTVQPLHDEYVEVLIPEGEEITIKFRHQENNALSCISNGDNIWCYDVALATINSNTPLTVTVKSPNITVNGVIRFQGAFFNIPYDKMIGTGLGALTIEGKMTYDILFSDKNADESFGDNVFLDGSYRYDYPAIQEIELPIGLFMTDDFLLPVIIIFICSAFTVSLFSFGAKTNSAPTQGKQNKSTKNNVAMVKQRIKEKSRLRVVF